MAINLQSIINSQMGVRTVSFLGRTIPPAIGYPTADLVTGWMTSRRHSNLIRAIRTNQWVIRGENPDKEVLDEAVRETLQNIGHSLYSLHHYVHDLEAVQERLDLNLIARGLVEQPEFSDMGLMLVGLHLSNFDLILQSMCMQGLKALVLTIPDPQNGRRLEYEMRKRTGMNLIPASLNAMRQAVQHLEAGGVVLTGMDRPVINPKVRPSFFRRPSNLPVHHIYLAMKARVPVMIVAARLGTDDRYHVTTSEPIAMETFPDHEKGTLHNAERVLKVAERFVSQAPEQWSISLPVWPDLLDKVPI